MTKTSWTAAAVALTRSHIAAARLVELVPAEADREFYELSKW